jgi:hypothetical protein
MTASGLANLTRWRLNFVNRLLLLILMAVGSLMACASALAATGAGAESTEPSTATGSIPAATQPLSIPATDTTLPSGAQEAVPTGKIARSRWDFEVLLDDSPIGSHRFTVTRDGDKTQVESLAAFDVKLLGLSVFRYRHEAREQWSGDCLVALQSKTNDDGTPEQVNARAVAGSGLQVRAEVKGATREQTLPGCVMSFAYWNPSMLRQTALLNGQTGKLTAVTIDSLPDGKVQVGSRLVEVRRYRLKGGDHPLVLSYSPQGEWLALESTVSGGKHLLYRLRR